MKTRAAAVVLAGTIVTITAPTRADAPQFGRIVTFGTSLSDPGNAFAMRGGTGTPPDYHVDPLLVPSAPYAMGGHHFSNGPTRIEQFARAKGLAGSARPAFASEGAGTNYAVAAARAREDGVNFNLPAQIDAFFQDYDTAPASALYVIEMGGNDIRDAAFAYFNGADGGPVLQAAIVSIAENVQTLYAAGARQFLVWRAPDVGTPPALRTFDSRFPGGAAAATKLSVAFNTGLDAPSRRSRAFPASASGGSTRSG